MEISLIRHGKSKFTDRQLITCNEFNDWVKRYDDKGVLEESSYPMDTLNKIQSASIVMTSDLKRSVESAMLLHQHAKVTSMPVFRETELPVSSLKCNAIKLHPNIWAVVLRCLWFSGYSIGCESYSDAKQRAQKAAQVLIEHSQEYKSSALVGHGFFNMLIAKELQKRGWKGKRRTSSKHWNCTTYYFHN
ncbi:histidine phosphatase family protein [Bacillus sp. FSL K6-3431]|uniref:histidine phosphatase family protein n=1 Tax=Bacillus sp. FSL K6-3431 TaxID=2921500 RepID=UPI0030F60761